MVMKHRDPRNTLLVFITLFAFGIFEPLKGKTLHGLVMRNNSKSEFKCDAEHGKDEKVLPERFISEQPQVYKNLKQQLKTVIRVNV